MLRICSFCALALVLFDSVAAAQPKTPRLDRYGDALPEGALLRIGTARLRAGAYIASMAFSADSKTLLTADRSSGVHVWDVATGKVLRSQPNINKDEPRWHEHSPFAGILLSPNGAHVAEVNNKSVCSVCDLATGKETFRIDRKHWQNLCHFRFSPDGKTLALQKNSNGEVTVFETASGELLHTLAPPNQACYNFLGFSPNGKEITVAGQNIPVLHYDLATGKRLGEFGDAKEGSFSSGTFSPDGKLFAFLSKFCTRLEIWDAVTHKHIVNLPGPPSNCASLTFTPDSRWIISPNGDTNLSIWEARTGKLIRSHTDRFGGFWHSVVSPDGKYLATSHGQIVEIRHLDTGKLLHDFPSHAGHSVTVQFGRDGKSLISSSAGRYHGTDTSAFIWDAVTGKQLADVTWAGGVWPVGAVSADTRFQAQGRGGEKIVVRELATKKIMLEVDEPKFVLSNIALTPDGRRMMVTMHEPISNGRFMLQLWDVAQRKKLLELNKYVHAELDATGRRLIVSSDEGQGRMIYLYDVATGRPLPRGRLTASNHRVILSPNGRLIAEAHWDGTPTKLRELASNEIVGEFDGTRGKNVSELAFSPDGLLVAAGVTDGTIFLWDVISRSEIAQVRGHRSSVRSLSWSPDGKRLASAGQDMTILVWDAEPWRRSVEPKEVKLTDGDLADLWDDLAVVKGSRGYHAVIHLSQSPKESLALLRKKLQPTTEAEAAHVRKLIKDLDDSRFSVREKANAALAKLGELAIPGLEKALASPLALEPQLRIKDLLQKLVNDPPPAGQMQQLRALTVLEMIGSREAIAILDTLAGGEAESWLTREASAAKERLADTPRP